GAPLTTGLRRTARGAGAAPSGARGRVTGEAGAGGPAAGATAARQTPPRDEWHRDPVKVFDNLYFLGQTEYSAWAVNTSDGIIIIDTIYDYSAEDEVARRLKKLGQEPAKSKYVVESQGNRDHSGGASVTPER